MIVVKNVNKRFGNVDILHDINVSIQSGQLVSLVGPSGSGKTTLLRVLAGLEIPDSGTVEMEGLQMEGASIKDREVGFVFQHYALFRHMSVFENVAFGLRVKPKKQRPSEANIKHKVYELLQLVQLDWAADRYPSQLSGGQRQRVALARALAVEPKLLLLDEPFGALDAKVRKELRTWLRQFHKQVKVTTVLVTHDQEEALEVATQVVVMNHGRIEQVGAPEEIYDKPATPFVLDFIGNVNLFHGRIEKGKLWLGQTPLASTAETSSADDQTIYVRPHHFQISKVPFSAGGLRGTVQDIRFSGSILKVDVAMDSDRRLDVEVSVQEAIQLQLAIGDTVYAFPQQVGIYDGKNMDFYAI